MAKRKHPNLKSLRQGQTVYSIYLQNGRPRRLDTYFDVSAFVVVNDLDWSSGPFWGRVAIRDYRKLGYRGDVEIRGMFYSRKTATCVAKKMTAEWLHEDALSAAECVLMDLEGEQHLRRERHRSSRNRKKTPGIRMIETPKHQDLRCDRSHFSLC